jgi:regulator of cell morphogenesis and NO signaling
MGEFQVEEFFGHDHDELDGHFKRYQELKHTDQDAAKESFKKFKIGLTRHIAWEDNILFPLFEDITGMKDSGPTAVMRAEHRQIEAALEALHKRVQARDPQSNQEEAVLLGLLKVHNDKEEGILYPAIDQMVSDKDRLAAYERMKIMETQAPKGGCSCGGHH